VAPRRIVLIRHGRSGHRTQGLHNLAAYRKWREAYEAAGIDPTDSAPRELLATAQDAAIVVSSDARRAIESARVLAPNREIITSPLLRELSLEPPNLRWIRLPLLGWAVAIGMRGRARTEEHERVRMAAQWLVEMSVDDRPVIVVTHATLRSLLAKELVSRGWLPMTSRRSWKSWSAWSLYAKGER
jgi:broad specificity phosphatase PhoE